MRQVARTTPQNLRVIGVPAAENWCRKRGLSCSKNEQTYTKEAHWVRRVSGRDGAGMDGKG
ncbi:hypothetical protein K439DRAFT_1626256 [Ramaria rubella]|nr:hypothetical protein K439DRAFT_1626256 [Ramaria rubella]